MLNLGQCLLFHKRSMKSLRQKWKQTLEAHSKLRKLHDTPHPKAPLKTSLSDIKPSVHLEKKTRPPDSVTWHIDVSPTHLCLFLYCLLNFSKESWVISNRKMPVASVPAAGCRTKVTGILDFSKTAKTCWERTASLTFTPWDDVPRRRLAG